MMTPHEYKGYELVSPEDLKIKHRPTLAGGFVYIDAPCGKKYKLMPRDAAVLADQLTSHAAAVMPKSAESVNFQQGSGTGTREHSLKVGIWDNKPEPELSLLVIDLGDSCVVKVEKGVLKFDEKWEIGERTYGIRMTFNAIKEIVDGCDALEDKPEPRLERHNKPEADRYYEQYSLIESEGVPVRHDLDSRTLRLLSKIVGHDLPIYEPKAGQWARLPSTAEYVGDPLESIGIAIWRYTK